MKMNKTKVLHVLYELKFSGAEIMYVDAAPLFQKKGCDLTVMGTANALGEYAPYFKNAGFEVIHKPIPEITNYINRIRYYIALIKFIKSNHFDIVHAHVHGSFWGIALCAWLSNVRCIYTYHNVFPTRFFTYPYHCLLRWSAKYIFRCRFQTISDSVYNQELKFYHNKTTKVYNWYGSNRYFPATNNEKIKAREDLGIEQNAFVFISVGGCSHVKRHSEILKCMPSLIEKMPNCLYLHLGKGVSENEEIQLAKDLDIENNVRFCNNQSDVRKYLIASDLYLMPSKFEGIPITTIEAMACQIPAILYNVPGLKDFNKTGENSILIPEDYQILGQKILQVSREPEKSLEMAVRAKNFVNQYFNMTINVDKIFELYKN